MLSMTRRSNLIAINLQRSSIKVSISLAMFKKQHFACILWITIAVLAISLPVQSGPVDENEIKKSRECKTFCGSCGCIGFYCGEECICECNEEKNDTECIAAIQANAKLKKIPFEILIQGPSGNRFLRNALLFDQNQQQCSKGDSGRTKRSTVVIYKPAAENVLDTNGYCAKPLEKSVDAKKHLFRGKRAVEVDSWFTDFTNTLVKPAPIYGKSVEVEDIEKDDEESAVEAGATADSEEILLPKIRGRIRNVLNEGSKGIRKTVKKIENKALKAVELEGKAKKIRGAISSLRNRAEEILMPSAEVSNTDNTKKEFSGRTLLNQLRGKIFRPFEDESDGIIS